MVRFYFHKVQGLGNDFVLFDLLAESRRHELKAGTSGDGWMTSDRVRRICDRHFGVGADGVLLALPPRTQGAAARMRILNADGSEAEMCGNGLRCVVRHLAVERGQRDETLHVETAAGVHACRVRRSKDGGVAAVRVSMGAPRFLHGGEERRHEVNGRSLRGMAVSMGNPHLVFFVEETGRSLAEEVGAALVAHGDYPEGTNVELATACGPREISLVVYERGVGITLACGTGAAATAAAACRAGLADTGAPLTVHLPGGDAVLEVAEDLAEVWLEGPAVEVYRGTWTAPERARTLTRRSRNQRGSGFAGSC